MLTNFILLAGVAESVEWPIYGWTVGFLFTAWQEFFVHHSVQMGCEALPATIHWTLVLFPGS